MMKFWNKRLKNAAEYLPGEQPEDLNEYIKLNTNENPFSPPSSTLDAIRKAADGTLRRYPDPRADSVRDAFAKKYGLKPENIFVANGSDEIFTLLLRGFIEPDEKAAFPFPSYSLYSTLAEINGIEHELVPLKKDFSYDLAPFLKKKYRLVIISNPNNPTGTVCDVRAIGTFLQKFKGLLVVDEAYIDFYGGTSIDLVKKFDNIIVTRSFSKSYSLAGLRVGIAAASPDIIKGLMKIKDSYNIDSLAIAGAAAALKDKKGFEYNRKMLINNKEYLEERLEMAGFEIVPSRANFLFVKHPKFPAGGLYEELKSRKILVRHFSGPVVSDYIRISIGTMQEIKGLLEELSSIMEG